MYIINDPIVNKTSAMIRGIFRPNLSAIGPLRIDPFSKIFSNIINIYKLPTAAPNVANATIYSFS